MPTVVDRFFSAELIVKFKLAAYASNVYHFHYTVASSVPSHFKMLMHLLSRGKPHGFRKILGSSWFLENLWFLEDSSASRHLATGQENIT